MRKQTLHKSTTSKLPYATRGGLFAIATMMAFGCTVGLTNSAFADKFDDQISAIQSQIDSYNSQAAALKAQAQTLQGAIAELDAQKAVIQNQINLSQAQHDKLVSDIDATQKKIDATKEVLAKTLADIYVNSDTTTLEMLASSKSIADYVDAQEYRSSVSDQIQSSISQIKTLKTDLEKQKAGVERTISDQQAQREVLAQKTAEQQNLLATTQGNEAAYQSMISKGNSDIDGLRAAQKAANAAATKKYGGNVTAGDANHGGYPNVWANSAQDTIVDNWGMYNRECVSYTSWRVSNAYGNMPYWGGRGNANQWPSNARAAGIPVGTTPKVGSVAVMTGGYYGHVAWVEAVNGDGTIHVSQYNWDLAGHYSEMTISASAFQAYIYFGN